MEDVTIISELKELIVVIQDSESYNRSVFEWKSFLSSQAYKQGLTAIESLLTLLYPDEATRISKAEFVMQIHEAYPETDEEKQDVLVRSRIAERLSGKKITTENSGTDFSSNI